MPVFFPEIAHRAHYCLERRRFEREVDEARTSDIHAFDDGIFRKMIDDDLGDLAWVLVGNFRKTHCDRARPIAVRFFTRALKAWLRHRFKRKAPSFTHAASALPTTSSKDSRTVMRIFPLSFLSIRPQSHFPLQALNLC